MDTGDFFQQLTQQSQILGLFAFFGLMLVLLVGALLAVRVRRMVNVDKPSQAPKPFTSPLNMGALASMFSGGGSTPPAGTANADADMPDLDMLLSTPAAAPTNPPPATAAPVNPAQPVPPRQPGIVDIRMADGRQVEAAEMLIISRDRNSDNLVVQIGELAYDGTEVSVDPDFRRRFVKIMRELADIAPALSKGAKAPIAGASAPGTAAAPPPRKTAPAAMPPAQSPAAPPAKNEGGALDLAGQIEAFLQQRLLATPEFAGRGLHVHSATDGGVQIEVDGQFFASVNDVTDPAVREYLRAIITEWQSLQ